MKQFILIYLTQLLTTVGSIVATGFFIHACKQLFVRACGKYGPAIVNYSGIIGTPVHELSHAAMCLLFGHKIKKIKLFGIDKHSGTLGFVQHSYNPKNLWHRIGNFFIGIAPVLAGSGVLLLFMRLLLPATFRNAWVLLATAADGALTLDSVVQLFHSAFGIFKLIFDPANLKDWHLWVFLIPSVTVAIHMDLSTADIKGGWNGFLFLAGGVGLIDIALYFINTAWLQAFTGIIVRVGFMLTSLLLLSVILAGIVGAFSLILLLLKKIF